MDQREELDRVADGRTVCSLLLDTVAVSPDVVALREPAGDGHRELTYRALAEQVARVAGGLRAAGVRRGDRVALMLRNRIAFHVADLAVLFAGGTPVSLYNTSSTEQVAYVAGHCRATTAILDGPHEAALFAEAADRLPLLHCSYVVDGAPVENTVSWEELLRGAPIDLDEAAATVAPDELATVIYTSGTTGPPKGVMISHRNVVWTIESQRLAFRRRPPGFRTVSYLPMAHIAERMVSHYDALASGYQVTTCAELDHLAATIAESRPELLFGVPRVWEKLKAGVEAVLAGDADRAAKFGEGVQAALPLRLAELRGELGEEGRAMLDFLDEVAFRPVRERIGLDACTLPVTSAAPIPRAVLEWFIAVGVPLFEVYGMSELTGPLTCNVDRRQPGTVGRPMPGCEVRIAEDGEVLARGGNVFVGYLDDPERTAETVPDDGWLHTGDIGVLEDGLLRIVDRKKELFITAGGQNVSPANLEAALRTVPLVGQACAIGDGRPFPVALVVLDPDAARSWARQHGRGDGSPAELAADPDLVAAVEADVARVMEPFNQAERVKRVAVLPDEWLPDSAQLTPTLKLKRRGILAAYADLIERLYEDDDDDEAITTPIR